ncbi:MAG: hypothetical protein ABFC38_03435 [Methanospirillum sp.]
MGHEDRHDDDTDPEELNVVDIAVEFRHLQGDLRTEPQEYAADPGLDQGRRGEVRTVDVEADRVGVRDRRREDRDGHHLPVGEGRFRRRLAREDRDPEGVGLIRLLEVPLSARRNGDPDRAPISGVPPPLDVAGRD